MLDTVLTNKFGQHLCTIAKAAGVEKQILIPYHADVKTVMPNLPVNAQNRIFCTFLDSDYQLCKKRLRTATP